MTRLNPRTGDPLYVEPDLDAWEPNHRPSLRRGLAILAVVLVIGLALGFAVGRALAARMERCAVCRPPMTGASITIREGGGVLKADGPEDWDGSGRRRPRPLVVVAVRR